LFGSGLVINGGRIASGEQLGKKMSAKIARLNITPCNDMLLYYKRNIPKK